MKDKIFGVLQRVGRSFMLPIAILPVAGLLLGLGASFTNETFIKTYHLTSILGQGTWLHSLLTIMSKVGGTIFGNLPIIFAVGVAIGMAKKEREVAALAALISYFVMNVSINAVLVITGKITADGQIAKGVLQGTIDSTCGIQTLQMGVFGGIIVGLGVAALHNRFHTIVLPNALSFFGGSRFVPIISTIVYMFVGILMYFIWPPVQNGIYALGGLVTGTGYIGTLIFGLVKRALIPFGLHHVFYLPFWQTAVGGTATVAGHVVQGGQNIFFAQLADAAHIKHFSADATRYFSGEFIFMIFGLPGAALAMYRNAKPEKKKVAGGLLLSAALTSMLTGITEPIEFSFLFVAPLLFVVQVILAGSCYMVAHMLHIAVGLTFSGGFIDLLLFGILQGNSKTSWLLIIPCGIVYFFLYYFIFSFLIKKFNFKTPGREDDDTDTKLFTKADYKAKVAEGKASDAQKDLTSMMITKGLGGPDNIESVDCCATSLCVTVKDSNLVEDNVLKATGSKGIVKKGTGVQVIYGPQVTVIKSKLEDFLSDLDGYEEFLKDISNEQEEVKEEKEAAKEDSKTDSSNANSSANMIYAPLTGKSIELSKVEDGVFSEGMLGQGAAIEPSEGKVYAPFDGEINMVFDTKHAIGLTSNTGLELLIHVGLDTVSLNGQFYDVKVSTGDKVKAGDLLVEFDMAGIQNAGYRTVTPVIVTNSDEYKEFNLLTKGDITHGDKFLEVK